MHLTLILILSVSEKMFLSSKCRHDHHMGAGWGGGGGAKVLGKLPVPGRPTNLAYRRTRAYCAFSRCGWSCLDISLSSITSVFFLPLCGRRPDID